MKKSLLALAVLGAFTGVASAQSSVTLYGTLDLNAHYVKNDGSNRRLSMAQDGINSSELGFKGVEDLGGGLQAKFVLRSGINADTGTANGKFWNRQSTVALAGGFGEVRLGRDYTPSFWNLTVYDPFGTNGVGNSLNTQRMYNGTRRDNSIGYFLPSKIGGLFGQAMVAASENGTTEDFPRGKSVGGRYVGGRIGFATGPFSVAGAYSQDRFADGSPDQKTANIGASYDLGILKLMGYFDQEKRASQKENIYLVGLSAALGQGVINASYDRSKQTGGTAATDGVIDQIAVGYTYNLSKRTAVYGTVSRLNNHDGTNRSIAGGNAITAGGKSNGAEVGIRHFF